MQINTVHDFRRAMRQGPYAWPGGYPTFFVCLDGGAISFETAREHRREILESIAGKYFDRAWRVIAFDINWEDSEMRCEHSQELIPSAYTDELEGLEYAE